MKLKTHKTTAKKIRITRTKKKKNRKLMTKTAGQNHFNARESGNVTRNKRRGQVVAKADLRNISRQLPYS